MDKEHGLYGTEELVQLTMQCRHMGMPVIVRVEDAVYHPIAKAIDLGGDGVMLPHTERVEQIESPAGLAAMEDMIAAYGDEIDGFIIGPNDYSIIPWNNP